MASFHSKSFLLHDDYMTPFKAWDNIKSFIPTDKLIWEGFYGNGQSYEYLKKLGFNVVSQQEDFFESNRGDILVTNPPFSKIPAILERLVDLEKPFIMIMPSSKINTSYIRETFKDDKLQIIIPRRRIQFNKLINGKIVESNKCNFDCFYYCWRMNLPKDIIWLE